MAIKYCAFPDAIVLDKPEGKHVQHLLWGDWLRLKGGKEDDWFEVDTRGEDGWLGRKGWLLILTGGIENRLGSIRFKAQRHVDG
ncbi:MAG: hypothetical protein QG591_1754 [Planctomycetota bacterium]|nr:hypothetical protein [Planctomycetota bacterium]